VEKSSWRSAAAYGYLDDADPADLAWEFLRRNPEYRGEYRKLNEWGAPDVPADRDDSDRLGRRWGLHFPGRSRH
jgi:hypothetical protein